MDLHPLTARTLPRCVPSNPLYRPTLDRAKCAASALRLATVAALSIALLGACGGGDDGDEHTAAAEPTAPARVARVDFMKESEYGPGDAPGLAAAAVAAASTRTASKPTVADEALADTAPTVADRAAAPVDRLAHTRRGRYVSRATAERHDAQSGGGVVWVDASCCAGLDPELPERIVFGMQAVLGEDLPLYVSGSDLRQAARLADRLDALGLQRVYLVTP